MVRQILVEQVRQEYIDICRSLEDDFRTERVSWKTTSTLCLPQWSAFDEKISTAHSSSMENEPRPSAPATLLAEKEGARENSKKFIDRVNTHSVSDDHSVGTVEDSLGSVSDLTLSSSSEILNSIASESDDPTVPLTANRPHNTGVQHGVPENTEQLRKPAEKEGDLITRDVDLLQGVKQEPVSPKSGVEQLQSDVELKVLNSEVLTQTFSPELPVLSEYDHRRHHLPARENVDGLTDGEVQNRKMNLEHMHSEQQPVSFASETSVTSSSASSPSPNRIEVTTTHNTCTPQSTINDPCQSGKEKVDGSEPQPQHSNSNISSSPEPQILTAEQIFYNEICGIISEAEKEGKSYQELKAQLVLELSWIKQAIRSRQQVCCGGTFYTALYVEVSVSYTVEHS